MLEALTINGVVVASTILEQAREGLLSENSIVRNFSEMILAQQNPALTAEQQLYIMEMLYDQLLVEVHCEEMMVN
jgi:hypothetical protein